MVDFSYKYGDCKYAVREKDYIYIVNEMALYVSEAALVVTTNCHGGKNLKERFLVKYGR